MLITKNLLKIVKCGRQLYCTGSPLGVFNFSTTNMLQTPRGAAKCEGQTVSESKTNHAEEDLQTIEKVEAALFENSGKTHNPVENSNQLLKNIKKEAIRVKKSLEKASLDKEFPTKKPQKKKETSTIVEDTELGLKFTKLNLNDPLLSSFLLTTRSKKSRDKNQEIIVEGRRLISEAIMCGLSLQTLLFSRKEQVAMIKNEIAQIEGVQVVKVPHHDLKMWSTLSTCPGLIGVFRRPDNNCEVPTTPDSTSSLPITVVCDNIREPTNLGSIIRVCAAIPCSQVIVLKGCCDPWESKALRGGCGGQFRINIKDDVHWEQVEDLLPQDSFVFVAESNLNKIRGMNDTNVNIQNYTDVKLGENHGVVIIGGETHGVSSDAYRFLAYKKSQASFVHIPLAQGVESLNTASALALILFEMRKHLHDETSKLEHQKQQLNT